MMMLFSEILLIKVEHFKRIGRRLMKASRLRCCGVSMNLNSGEKRKADSPICQAGVWDSPGA